MRVYPEDETDREDLAELNAEPWMVEQLKLNPEYPHWGPYEDCMAKPGGGWEAPVVHETWLDFTPLALDDWNEVVHFYFEIDRAADRCPACTGSGYNEATERLSDDWYDMAGTGRRWCNALTQDEVALLHREARLFVFHDQAWGPEEPCPSAEAVNKHEGHVGHDAINRGMMVRARAERLGVYGLCAQCSGHGYVYTVPVAQLGLVLWVLHPRKGASRGVHVKRIERRDLPSVYRFLRSAADRNAERFSRIPIDPERP